MDISSGYNGTDFYLIIQIGSMINLKDTAIFEAVKLSRNPLFKRAGLLYKIFIFSFSVGAVVSFLAVAETIEIGFSAQELLGLTFFFLSLALSFWQLDSFFDVKLKHPKRLVELYQIDKIEEINIAEFFSFKVADAFYRGKGVGTFLFHLLADDDFKFIFSRAGIDLSEVREDLKEDDDSELLEKIIIASAQETADRKGGRIKKNDVLVAAYKEYPYIREVFDDKGINGDDIRNLSNWIYKLKQKESEEKRFWEWKNLIKRGSLAKDWASGYTILLDKFSSDWTDIFKKVGFPEIVGRDQEVDEIERILSREKGGNVVIVGEPGVGRKSAIQELTKRSFYGESLPGANHKRVVEFDIPFLLANTQDRNEAERLLEMIFSEVAESGNTILVIPEIHNFIGTRSTPGRVDISGILLSYLSLPQFRVIGITDYGGYRRSLEGSSAGNLFEKVEIKEISHEDVIRHLQNVSFQLEAKNRKVILYSTIKETVNYCARYFPNRPFPEKATDLLDEAMTYLVQTKGSVLLPEHIAKLVSDKTNIPVGEMKGEEKEMLLNLEDLIHRKVINQEEAVREVSSALRRARSEISARKKPMGTFLFLGPTGVGKTETAKALTEVYFGSSKKMIRVDMSEFQTLDDIARLIGSPKNEGFLTTKVREEPFSLILLDELEKAHTDLLNLFLQVLDEGHLTDGLGRKVDFKNSIIIATSNAGSKLILESIRRDAEWKEELLNTLFSEGIFRPEFINRFDSVVLFSPLSQENLIDIAQLLLNKTVKGLKERNIDFVVTRELKEKIAEIGYNPSFGARELQRVIQDKIENPIASALIADKLNRGSSFVIDPDSFEINFL